MAQADASTHTQIYPETDRHTHTHRDTEREREREGEREGERENVCGRDREKERDNVCVREKTGRETENVSENVSGFVWLPKHCTENIIATRKESWPNFELRFVTMYVWTLLRKNKNTHNWITCVSINQVFKYTTLSPDARTVQTQTIVHKSNSIYRPFAVGKPPVNRTSFVPYLPN